MLDAWYLPQGVVIPFEERYSDKYNNTKEKQPYEKVSVETLSSYGVALEAVPLSSVFAHDVDAYVRPLLRRLNYTGYDVMNISPEIATAATKTGERVELGGAAAAKSDSDEDEEERGRSAAAREEIQRRRNATLFEETARHHFTPHVHEDNEVRLILKGRGFFDICAPLPRQPRAAPGEQWVRIQVREGHCLSLPAGIVHRFTTDATLKVSALRLFQQTHSWTHIPVASPSNTRPVTPTEAQGRRVGEQIHQSYVRSLQRRPFTILGKATSNHNIYHLRFPDELDETLNSVVRDFVCRHMHSRGAAAGSGSGEELQKLCAVFYLLGSRDPQRRQSWCPDCVVARDEIAKKVTALRDSANDGDAARMDNRNRNRFLFVELPVERASYIGNPHYPYRTHRTLQLASVPTLLTLRVSDALFKAGATNDAVRNMRWDDILTVVERQTQFESMRHPMSKM